MNTRHRWIACCLVALLGALGARADDAPLTPAQVDELIARVPAAGPVRASRDPSENYWGDDLVSRQLHDAIAAHTLTGEQLDRLVAASAIVTTRDRWIAGDALVGSVGYPKWAGRRGRIRVTPKLAGATRIEIKPIDSRASGQGTDAAAWMRSVHFGTPATDATSIEFSIEVQVCDSAQEVPTRWTTTLTRPIELVGDATTILTPVTDEAVTEAVRKSIRLEPEREHASAPARICAIATLHGTCIPFAAQMAMPVIVEVRNPAGEVVNAWPFDLNTESLQDGMGLLMLRADEDFDQKADRTGWTVRIRPDDRRAIRNLRFDSYWAGEIDVPLDEILVGGR